jgi:N utilization substance protein B
MNRRKAREYALQLLFQIDFTGKKNEFEIAENFRDNKKEDVSLKKFAEELVSGTISNLVKIDKIIQESAEHWKVDRMAAVDRNILRFAVYEILYRNDIPPAVTINEALEIAKKYSSSDSAPFINGLLDKIAHDSGKA